MQPFCIEYVIITATPSKPIIVLTKPKIITNVQALPTRIQITTVSNPITGVINILKIPFKVVISFSPLVDPTTFGKATVSVLCQAKFPLGGLGSVA